MNLICINDKDYDYIEVGKGYKIIEIHNTGVTVRNDKKESVFYPNHCFGLLDKGGN